MRKSLFTAAAVLAFALPAGAQTMKPGLWEMNNKMSGGQMDHAMAEMQKQLAQMSPEERKQMQAAMAQHGVKMMPGAAGGGMVVQMCMTRDMVERNDVPMEKGCTSTQQKKSGNRIQYAFSCSNPPSSGEGEVSFTPETYTSRSSIKAVVDGKPETMTMQGTGRWLKANCGDVKPMPLPKK
jgi:hypothetical protein